MKRFVIVLFSFFSLVYCGLTQGSINNLGDKIHSIRRNELHLPRQTIYPKQSITHFSHYKNFYRKNLNAKLLFSPDYEGISTTWARLRTDRTSLGISMEVNQLLVSNQPEREFIRNWSPKGQYFFIPLLLNVKFHLYQNANMNDFVPYIIAGLGPALGLYIPYGYGFFKNLGRISSEIGGGGFIGMGVDYLWQEQWALSFDLRYNLFHFSHPLGENQEYKGLSIFFGFTRAIDY